MSRRKEGIVGVGCFWVASQMTSSICFADCIGSCINYNSMWGFAGGGFSSISLSSYSSNKSQQVLDSSYSSNKPGFVGVKINKGIDDKLLKGGFRKI